MKYLTPYCEDCVKLSQNGIIEIIEKWFEKEYVEGKEDLACKQLIKRIRSSTGRRK